MIGIKIEKVENGFLVTEYSQVADQSAFAGLGAPIPSSYRIPMREVERRIVFENWNDLQKHIRKCFGVCE